MNNKGILTVLHFNDNDLKYGNIISQIETMIEKLNTFITVVDEHSFAKAAKKLRLSRATVTRHIQELEAEFKAPLLVRTTRHLSLSEQGETFYRYALEMVQLHEETQEKIHNTAHKIEGNIKIGLPVSILQHFTTHAVKDIIQKYPALSIEIVQGNHVNDLLSKHFDLVIHCGPLPDVNFFYEAICDWQIILAASPGYLKKFGTPKKINDLTSHRCLDHSDNHTLCWRLNNRSGIIEVPIKSQIRVNSSLILAELAIQDLGIVYLPSFTVTDALKTQRLKAILKSAWREPMKIFALYPQRKSQNKKVAFIVEELKRLFNHAPGD